MMLSAKNFNFKKFLKKFIYGGIKQVCLRKGFTISAFTTYLCRNKYRNDENDSSPLKSLIYVIDVVLVSLVLSLSIFQTLLLCFYC